MLAAAGVLAVLTVIPGPDTAVVTRHALGAGTAAGVRVAAGVACGLFVWGALAVAGVNAVLTALPQLYLTLKVLGVLYLLYLAVQAWRGDATGREDDSTRPRPRAFAAGLMANLLNPKIALFYAALLPTLAPPPLGAWGMAGLVLVHIVLTLLWLSGFSYLLSRARRVAQRPRARRVIERVTGAVLVAFAVRLATGT